MNSTSIFGLAGLVLLSRTFGVSGVTHAYGRSYALLSGALVRRDWIRCVRRRRQQQKPKFAALFP